MAMKLILLDADDTLWHNMRHFEVAEAAFADMIGTFADVGIARSTLAKVEERNLKHYGYGAKSFTLSMIEAAVELGGSALPVESIAKILETGRELLRHPVELLEGVGETIEELAEMGDLVLLTKGDLLHQETKLAASGLGSYFAAVEIVSDKTVDTFNRLFARRGVDPAGAIMAGDSLRSDIVPALEAGAWAAFVPQPLAWSHEHAPEPSDAPRYRRLSHLRDLPALIADINQRQG
ncbi:HAD family hydrolase [Sphingomonas sp. IC-11]|uniref:HAD family hydrolase n=1 Tax=Sphingomonas sp. IC-11 TaxID=2898528 RepID=UPI001E5B1108|nr:HAD family hydrolase [Sphingomonas sp. IC-11]MCD2315383.1 HAD family hydrolase [Sphingomonas sp. IC-11]